METGSVAMAQEYSYRYLRFVITHSPQTGLFVAEASWHGIPLSVSASTYEELLVAIRSEVDSLKIRGHELHRHFGEVSVADDGATSVEPSSDE